jgi:hypothetical protein
MNVGLRFPEKRRKGRLEHFFAFALIDNSLPQIGIDLLDSAHDCLIQHILA